MKTASEWFCAYGETHQNRLNKRIHYICVPLITWSVLTLVWKLPFPIKESPVLAGPVLNGLLNWAVPAVLLTSVFYFQLGFRYFAVMLLLSLSMVASSWALQSFGLSLVPLALSTFVLAWIGQFYGHMVEGKKPSFFDDLKFLLIGPLWIMNSMFRLQHKHPIV